MRASLIIRQPLFSRRLEIKRSIAGTPVATQFSSWAILGSRASRQQPTQNYFSPFLSIIGCTGQPIMRPYLETFLLLGGQACIKLPQ